MSRADYAHWNEDADRIWWEEEGKHYESDSEADEFEFYSAADAYAEEVGEWDDDELLAANAEDYTPAQWKQIEWEIKFRGMGGRHAC